MSHARAHSPRSPFLAALTLAALGACHDSGGSGDSATVATEVALTFDDGSAFDLEGASVFVDDVLVGLTGPGGTLPVQVPRNGFVRVLAGTSLMGEIELDGFVPAPLPLAMRGDVQRFAQVGVEQAQDGLLARDAGALTLRLSGRKDVPIALAAAPSVIVRDANNLESADVTAQFAVQGAGELVCTDVELVLSQAAEFPNDVEFVVAGEDTDGATLAASVKVLLGQHAATFLLAAPPSNPSLPVAGVELSATRIGSELTFTASSDGAGLVELEHLPTGTYELLAQVQDGAETYTGSGALFVNGDTAVTLNLLGLEDVLAGVPSYEITPFAFRRETSPAGRWARIERSFADPRTSTSALSGGGVLSVTSGAEDEIVTQSQTFEIPQGSTVAQLEYEVQSDEYPDYVQDQSEFNDNWTLKVLGPSGAPLFSIARNVNQQLYVDPLWNEAGSTGVLAHDLNVSALTATAAASLTLVLSATNIGDSALPTTVSARIQASSFKISSIERDSVSRVTSCGDHSKAQNNQDAFSIPLAGGTNARQRTLTVRLAGRPAQAQVTNVRVELLDRATSTLLATVVDQAPDGATVRHLASGGDRVAVIVTNPSTNPSQVDGTSPPPAQEILYRVRVEVLEPGASPLTAEKDSAAYLALWRMPDVFTRTGCRDEGQDDWCSRAASIWLEEHATLMSAINDISGEHARNTGHDTHGLGTDVDMRQFPSGTFPSNAGATIYTHLAARVAAAIPGDPLAEAEVNAWVLAQRAGIEPLIELDTVASVLVGIGGSLPGNALPNRWLENLLLQGEFAVPGGPPFTIDAGTWTHADIAKVDPTGGHNDHHHVTLDLD